jgi:uridine phosphorylase
MTKTSGLMHHLKMKEGDVGRYVLLPGDPGRCAHIARFFDDAELVAQNREYTTFTGRLLGEKISVTSTGIGGPSTAIAVEELSKIGADTFIRVGTSGGLQPHVQVGDLVVAWAAVREEGTTQLYVPLNYPAVADLDATLALRQAVEGLGFRHHIGIARTTDSFYASLEPERLPAGHELQNRLNAWTAAGVLCSEMEAATVFVVSSVLRKRAGCILLIASNKGLAPLPPEELARRRDLDPLIWTAIEALKILIEKDRRQPG